MEECLSLGEAAQYLGLESTLLWRAAEEGALKAERVNEVWRFSKPDLDAWHGSKPSAVPTEVHLATLELVQQNQQTIERLQRQMLQVQLAAAQGQRLLAESNETAHQERARLHALEHKLGEAESELKVWKERASRPWWRRLWNRESKASAG